MLGYIGGVWDLFHIGHLNILRNCKSLCDRLIVGVTTDKLVAYKHKKAVIPFNERIDIIRSIKYVDIAIPQTEVDKFEIWRKIKFDVLFVGDDWYKNEKWVKYENKLKRENVKIMYLPYTKKTSSTLINQILLKERSRTIEPNKMTIKVKKIRKT